MIQAAQQTSGVIAREEAGAAGYKRYFTGVPCMRGHVAERLVTNTRCVQCHREKAKVQRAADPRLAARLEAAASAAIAAGKNLLSRQEAIALGARHFFTGVACIRGHISERLVSDHSCKECNRAKAAQERALNPELVRRRVRQSYQRHIEKQREQSRQYMNAKYASNPEAFRDRLRQRRASDPVFAFNHRARQMVRSALMRTGFRKANKTEALLGCSLAEFRGHIQRQFLPGMGWHNMRAWEIDHIVPISTAKTKEEAEALNHFTNLRPLWKIDNRSKHSKTTHLI
jgi:hypothetical protein